MKRIYISVISLLVIFSTLFFIELNILYKIIDERESLQKERNNIYVSCMELDNKINMLSKYVHELDIIYTYSVTGDVPPEVILAVMRLESNFNPYAVSYTGKSFGIMQINEIHTQHLEDKLEILDIKTNVESGVSLLSGLKKQNDDIYYILGSYNMGVYGYKNYVKNTKNVQTEYSKRAIKIIRELNEKREEYENVNKKQY
jgi:soluble lytic murein transglycosylase-like protein